MIREFYSKKFWRQWSYSVYPYSSHILRVVSWILTMPTYLHRVKNKITHTVINKILHIAYLLEWQALMEMFSYLISHLLFFSQTFWATKLIPMHFFWNSCDLKMKMKNDSPWMKKVILIKSRITWDVTLKSSITIFILLVPFSILYLGI